MQNTFRYQPKPKPTNSREQNIGGDNCLLLGVGVNTYPYLLQRSESTKAEQVINRVDQHT
jgi:hypothetical protein